MQINHIATIQFWINLGYANASHKFQIMQQSTFNMTIGNNLIPENEISNKSKNPTPDYEEHI